MTDTIVATQSADITPSAAEPAIATHVAGGNGNLSMRDAARSVIDWRRKSAAGEAGDNSGQDASAADAATPDPNVSAQADPAVADGQPPGETESQDAAAETLPPVDPPRSWTKDEKERFKSLPRETQEYLASREQERDREFRTRQNEAAEHAKALEAERAKVEMARGQYEQALPILLQNLQSAYSGEFADIRTMDDVQKLAVSDPIRYTQWDAAQKRMAAVQQEIVATHERNAVERQNQLNQFRQREAELFAEKAPEFRDEAQAKKLMDGAIVTLRDIGFSERELGELWRGDHHISIHDHRFQLLLRDGVKWRDAQAAAKTKTAQAKPLPPVVRPGVAKGANAAREEHLKSLDDQINKSSGVNALRAAAKLVTERRRAG